MDDKIRQSIDKEYQMKISMTRQLLKYLLQGRRKTTGNHSRAEAFYDLIDRHYTALLSGHETPNDSFRELSRAWHWNRDTTAAFLENLERLGVVTIDMEGNRKTVRMNCITLTKDSSGALQGLSEPKTPSSVTHST